MVLGVNMSDAQEKVTDILDKNGVNFPNVLDTSLEARNAMMKYETLGGMSAVPMTYLVDREGKVMDAWYGYHKRKTQKAVRALKLE